MKLTPSEVTLPTAIQLLEHRGRCASYRGRVGAHVETSGRGGFRLRPDDAHGVSIVAHFSTLASLIAKRLGVEGGEGAGDGAD